MDSSQTPVYALLPGLLANASVESAESSGQVGKAGQFAQLRLLCTRRRCALSFFKLLVIHLRGYLPDAVVISGHHCTRHFFRRWVVRWNRLRSSRSGGRTTWCGVVRALGRGSRAGCISFNDLTHRHLGFGSSSVITTERSALFLLSGGGRFDGLSLVLAAQDNSYGEALLRPSSSSDKADSPGIVDGSCPRCDGTGA